MVSILAKFLKPEQPNSNKSEAFFEHFFAFHSNPWILDSSRGASACAAREPSGITPVQLEMTYLFYPN